MFRGSQLGAESKAETDRREEDVHLCLQVENWSCCTQYDSHSDWVEQDQSLDGKSSDCISIEARMNYAQKTLW